MAPGVVQVSGTSQFTRGVRTQLTGGSVASNNVDINAVRDIALDYNAEVQQLNSGRLSQKYFIGELQRMRESFFLYARDTLR
jgi:hypothetical protein